MPIKGQVPQPASNTGKPIIKQLSIKDWEPDDKLKEQLRRMLPNIGK